MVAQVLPKAVQTQVCQKQVESKAILYSTCFWQTWEWETVLYLLMANLGIVESKARGHARVAPGSGGARSLRIHRGRAAAGQ